MTTVVNYIHTNALAHKSDQSIEGRKNLLNSSPSTSIRAPITESGPQQSKSAHCTFRPMRVMCKVLQFDSRSVVAMTEMDHSCPCFAETDKHEVGHPRGGSRETREVCLLAASAYFVANATKLHPITTPIPAHHSPTMTLAQNNDLPLVATVPT